MAMLVMKFRSEAIALAEKYIEEKNAELEGEAELWEERYEELLKACGGVWPG
jgi:hypothetical protein